MDAKSIVPCRGVGESNGMNNNDNNNDNNNEDESEDELQPLSERKRKLSITEESKIKFEKEKGRLLQELEEKIDKCKFLENEEEKIKLGLENELSQINYEYENCKKLFTRNNEYINYQQVLNDKCLELYNEINYSIVKIEKYQYLCKLFINCYYYIDKSNY